MTDEVKSSEFGVKYHKDILQKAIDNYESQCTVSAQILDESYRYIRNVCDVKKDIRYFLFFTRKYTMYDLAKDEKGISDGCFNYICMKFATLEDQELILLTHTIKTLPLPNGDVYFRLEERWDGYLKLKQAIDASTTDFVYVTGELIPLIEHFLRHETQYVNERS